MTCPARRPYIATALATRATFGIGLGLVRCNTGTLVAIVKLDVDWASWQ